MENDHPCNESNLRPWDALMLPACSPSWLSTHEPDPGLRQWPYFHRFIGIPQIRAGCRQRYCSFCSLLRILDSPVSQQYQTLRHRTPALSLTCHVRWCYRHLFVERLLLPLLRLLLPWRSWLDTGSMVALSMAWGKKTGSIFVLSSRSSRVFKL